MATLGALVLHGFTSSLDTVNGLVPRLEQAGVPYRLPVLRGHGTRPEDLVGVRWQDWVEDASAALDELVAEADRVVPIGLSMGGLVALTLAADRPERMAGVVAIAPALRIASPLVPLAGLIARVMPWMELPAQGFADPSLAGTSTNYTRAPTRAIVELVTFGRVVARRLPEVRAPLLVIAPRHDRVIRPASAEAVYRRAGSTEKRLVWFERSGHEMLQDLEREAVLDEIAAFVVARRRALISAA